MTKITVLNASERKLLMRLRGVGDPVSAITGGIGLIGNLAGGLIGSSAASKAAAQQVRMGQEASDKVGTAVGQANAPIAAATSTAQDLATAGANRVLDTAGQAKATSDEMSKNANALLDPYSSAGQAAAGTLQTGLAAGGDFNKTPTLQDLQIDPGYAFRLQQGIQAQQRSAAAHGGVMGGQAAKDLEDFSQGSASQEYQDAFNRFETSTQNRFSNLNAVSNSGQIASTKQGTNMIDAAQYGGNITTGAATTALGANEFAGSAGMTGANEIANNITGGAAKQADILTGVGNAQAAGTIGAANAWSGALSGGANAIGGALTTANLLKNPALIGKVNVNVGAH